MEKHKENKKGRLNPCEINRIKITTKAGGEEREIGAQLGLNSCIRIRTKCTEFFIGTKDKNVKGETVEERKSIRKEKGFKEWEYGK